MADIKISQLTAKGSVIANTDLLEISESDGAGGYVTKSVTGANIIGSKQDTLISGTNIKTINSNSILGSGDLVITGGVTSVSATTPVVATGTTTPVISLASAYGDTLNPYASKTANNILAAPNGTAGVPTFRAIVSADIPTLNQNTTGTASNVTGIVALANGGTGTATPSLVAGTNVTITGTFPNQTINSSGGGGGIQGLHALFNLQSGDVIGNNFGGFGNLTISALVNNRIALMPFLPNQNITTSNLQIEVSVAQGGSNCRILIYSNLNGLPDTKIFESASLDCSTVGTRTAITTQTFTAGTTYWIGVHGQNTASIWAFQASQSLPLKLTGSVVANYLYKDVTFGSAPASFGTPTDYGNIPPYLIRITKA